MPGANLNPMAQGGIPKPNPYVIAETKPVDGDQIDVTFKYPRTKVFVGGLDFKLTVEELKQHFSQYGEVVDGCILKDIYTGQSRGFGFVLFKDEDVAQNLIRNIQVTTINGRKADIKKAEPKLGGQPFNPQRGGPQGAKMYPGGGGMDYGAPASIPPYGVQRYEDNGRSRSHSRDRGDERRSSGGGHHHRDVSNRYNVRYLIHSHYLGSWSKKLPWRRRS